MGWQISHGATMAISTYTLVDMSTSSVMESDKRYIHPEDRQAASCQRKPAGYQKGFS